ncbi:hypothetical protein [Amantichitinum ursilacus]|uniref:Uncharacterized protein n=1 Tax=Amantichitinum ursilacus TaxID=857265 RepID=A0A0N0GQM2_9NEIS|nr:hypothetical protein [Amantichitinum ursilacus]KPC54770.1 hypothetical protein WG78_04335 [Amantichitinum ursilacus]
MRKNGPNKIGAHAAADKLRRDIEGKEKMQFINEAPLYKIVRIVGPKHNLLGLELSDYPLATPATIDALNGDENPDIRLNPEEIAFNVRKGVELAAEKAGRAYYIKRIQYVSSDSEPASIYEYLAFEIIKRVCAL